MHRNHNLKLIASVSHIVITAFNNNGWKKNDDGTFAVDDNGNPIWIGGDGNELSVSGDTINRLNGEAKNHRTRAEAAENKLKTFEGLDPEKARSAIEMVGKLDQKKLIDAGEVDKVRQEVAGQYQTQLDEAKKSNGELQGTIDTMKLDMAFQGSEFVRDRIAVPSDMFRSAFGKNFKVEDGKIVPYYNDGNVVYSKKRISEVASFDEALELIVDTYAGKDAILKANGGGGTGNNGGGGNSPKNRTMRRTDFDGLGPMEKAKASAEMGKGELTIVD